MDTHIRWIKGTDLDTVHRIDFEVNDYPSSELREIMKQQNTVCLVAASDNDDDIVRGFIIYRFLEPVFDILHLAVDGDCWKQGVGTALLNKIKDKVSINTTREIRITITESNLRAARFLKNRGFVSQFVHKDYFETGVDGYTMIWRKP